MPDIILWSVWYGALVALPPIMTMMLIKNAMARAVGRRRVLPSIKRR